MWVCVCVGGVGRGERAAEWLLSVGMLGGRAGWWWWEGGCQGVGIIADSILRA